MPHTSMVVLPCSSDSKMSVCYRLAEEIQIDMGVAIGYSFTYLKDTHKAFVEYYNYNSIEHVKLLNDKFKSKLK